jgi:hypothetical protein
MMFHSVSGARELNFGTMQDGLLFNSGAYRDEYSPIATAGFTDGCDIGSPALMLWDKIGIYRFIRFAPGGVLAMRRSQNEIWLGVLGVDAYQSDFYYIDSAGNCTFRSVLENSSFVLPIASYESVMVTPPFKLQLLE